jgi:hypothetical protein
MLKLRKAISPNPQTAKSGVLQARSHVVGKADDELNRLPHVDARCHSPRELKSINFLQKHTGDLNHTMTNSSPLLEP